MIIRYIAKQFLKQHEKVSSISALSGSFIAVVQSQTLLQHTRGEEEAQIL
jgi:hypothetical protein